MSPGDLPHPLGSTAGDAVLVCVSASVDVGAYACLSVYSHVCVASDKEMECLQEENTKTSNNKPMGRNTAIGQVTESGNPGGMRGCVCV